MDPKGRVPGSLKEASKKIVIKKKKEASYIRKESRAEHSRQGAVGKRA